MYNVTISTLPPTPNFELVAPLLRSVHIPAGEKASNFAPIAGGLCMFKMAQLFSNNCQINSEWQQLPMLCKQHVVEQTGLEKAH